MKNKKSKNVFSGFGAWLKERVRKFFVALKKNPQSIPLVALSVAFVQFSLNLSSISNTTAKIQGQNMGLAQFVSMLFMLLSFVCMFNAFPKRKKPNIPMNILLIVLYGLVIFADVHYLNCINNALNRPVSPIIITAETAYIQIASQALKTHIILVAITVLCVILEPLIAKLLKKIKTSIEVEGSGDIATIDIADEE